MSEDVQNKALCPYREPFLFVSLCNFLYLNRTMDGVLVEYACAYCGEGNETLVDPTAGAKQSYVEDCSVCCRPNVLSIRVEQSNGDVVIQAVTEE